MAATAAKHQANRWPALLDSAAAHFAERGYHATTMRDIAHAAGVTPGAVYFHVPTKQALLVAVYAEGVDRITRHVEESISQETDASLRFRQAIKAHLESILDASAFARVIVRVVPDDVPEVAAELRAQRDRYEVLFRVLISALGALNWTPVWYRPSSGGLDAIVDEFVASFGVGASRRSPKPRGRSK